LVSEAITIASVIAGLIFGLLPALYFALKVPHTPQEIGLLVLVTMIGVAYLLVTNVNPLNPDGTGAIAYFGAGALGMMLIGGGVTVLKAVTHGTKGK
jgi:hypothetical protein